MTRAAAVLSIVAVTAGILDARLLKYPLIGFIAACALGLAGTAIVLGFWGISPRSRRLRKIVFWIALVVNLGIVGIISGLFIRSMRLPPLPIDAHPNADARSGGG